MVDIPTLNKSVLEFRSLIENKDGFIDSTDPLVTTHGGYFASSGHFDD